MPHMVCWQAIEDSHLNLSVRTVSFGVMSLRHAFSCFYYMGLYADTATRDKTER